MVSATQQSSMRVGWAAAALVLFAACCASSDTESTPAPAPAPAQAPAPSGELDIHFKPVKPLGVFKTIESAIRDRLESDSCQWFNGILALVAGLVLMLDGEFCFKYTVVAAIGLFTYLVAVSEVDATWADHFNEEVRKAIAIEVALAVAGIAWLGYRGIPVLIGMLLGFVACFYLHAHLPQSLADNAWFVLVYSNLLVITSTYFFTGTAHRRITAIISSVAGGLMVSSAVLFFVDFLCVQTGWLQSKLHFSTKVPAWIDFVYLLAAPKNKPEVGIFAQTSPHVDMIIGIVLWALLAIIGLANQIRLEKKQKQKKVAPKKQPECAKKGYLGSLKESLLRKKGGGASSSEP